MATNTAPPQGLPEDVLASVRRLYAEDPLTTFLAVLFEAGIVSSISRTEEGIRFIPRHHVADLFRTLLLPVFGRLGWEVVVKGDTYLVPAPTPEDS